MPADAACSLLAARCQTGSGFPAAAGPRVKAPLPRGLCSRSRFQSPGSGWGRLSTAPAGSAGGGCMHGRISRRGSGFCHRNCKRDSSAGLNASTEKERREAAGGQPPWGDNTAHARGTALGTESGAVGASIFSWMGAPLQQHITSLLCWTQATVGCLLSPHHTMDLHQPPRAGREALSRAPHCPLRWAPQLLRNELAPAHRLLSWYARLELQVLCLSLLPGLAGAGPLPGHPPHPSCPLPIKAAEPRCWRKTGAEAKSDGAK